MLACVGLSIYCRGQNAAFLKAAALGRFAGRERLDVAAAGLRIDSIYGNINGSMQDRAGNIWFSAMRLGVFRYDGKSFTSFSMRDGLANNNVGAMLEDKAGNIWFGTDSGISRYDGKIFTSVPLTIANVSNFYRINTSAYNLSVYNPVRCIFQDRSGTMWFGTDQGLFCYDGKVFTLFLDTYTILNKDQLTLKSIGCMYQDKEGKIWLGSGLAASEGLVCYDGRVLTRYKPNGDGWIRKILEDKHGDLWFACRFRGLCRYNGKAFINMTLTESEGLSREGTGALIEDKAGGIWFSTYGKGEGGKDWALWRFSGKAYQNLTLKNRIFKGSVDSILEDKDGNLWIGTRGLGLYRYDGKTFTLMTRK